jgi:chaperonin GroEL (HSP60 family)
LTLLFHSQLIKFSGVAGEACTVVLRGATGQMIEEADRSLHDALSVLSQTVKETRVTFGGGCAEMTMAVAVDEEAKRTEGKKALAVEAFARALRQVRRLFLSLHFLHLFLPPPSHLFLSLNSLRFHLRVRWEQD